MICASCGRENRDDARFCDECAASLTTQEEPVLGEDIYFVKDWLGHKNIQNTTIYARFSTSPSPDHVLQPAGGLTSLRPRVQVLWG